MPLNNSGPISLGGFIVGESVNLQLGKAGDAQISMNDSDARALAQKGGVAQQISLSDFRGKPVTPSVTPAVSITPSRTPAVSITPTPSLTPPITPTPSTSRPPAPTYREYNVDYCAAGTGTVLSTGILAANGTTVYKPQGVTSGANCFVVTSFSQFTTGVPTTFEEVSDCFDGACIQL